MVFYLKTAGYLNKFFNLQCNVLALGKQSQEKKKSKKLRLKIPTIISLSSGL